MRNVACFAPMRTALGERAPRIEEAAPILGVIGGQQNLGRGYPQLAQNLLIGMHELHLAGCRGGLQVFQSGAAFVDTEHGATNGNGARRYDQDFVIVLMQIAEVVGERLQPMAIQSARVIHEQR